MTVLTEILELIKNQAIPCIIEIAELMGVFIVAVSLIKAMYYYIRSTFLHQPHSYLFELGSGLSTALEFKMAAEILKTVLATTLEELLLVAAVFGLRALMSLLLHYELHGQENHPGKLDSEGNKHEESAAQEAK